MPQALSINMLSSAIRKSVKSSLLVVKCRNNIIGGITKNAREEK